MQSSSSKKVLKSLHIKDDSIDTHDGSKFMAPPSDETLTLTNMNTMHDFTHMLARIFRSTLVLDH